MAFLCFFGYVSISEIAGLHSGSIFKILRTLHCFQWWLHQFTVLSTVLKCPLFFTPSLTFISHDCDDSHSSKCGVISHCGFDLRFSEWLVMMSIFSCIYLPFMYHLWKNVYSGPLSILKLNFIIILLLSLHYLYILNFNPLLDVWLANIFFPFCRFVHFVDQFFCYAKLFILM